MSRISKLFLILLTLSLVGCDHVTKQFAVNQLQENPRVLFGGLLEFTYTENRDMAFGLMSHVLDESARLWLLTGLKMVAVAGGLYFLVLRREISSVAQKVAVALVTAGAAGNLIDRLARGYVIDFVKLPHWPVFNIADVVIVMGFVLLFIDGLRESRRTAHEHIS